MTTTFPPDHDEIRQQKKELRRSVRGAIKELTHDDIQLQSNKVWEKVMQLPVYQSAKSVGLFLSMPSGEINTDPILLHAVQAGKQIYVPEVGKNFEKCDMEMRQIIVAADEVNQSELFHKNWPRNKWQIPEPPEEMEVVTAKPGDIELLIVPGLAFDRKSNRLGQGKGYYDRFIERMTTNNTALPLVAVGLTPQLVDVDIPVADYDQPMDMVLLPDETVTKT